MDGYLHCFERFPDVEIPQLPWVILVFTLTAKKFSQVAAQSLGYLKMEFSDRAALGSCFLLPILASILLHRLRQPEEAKGRGESSG